MGRTKSHRDAMIKNMIRSLVTYERIKTTLAKAKLVKRHAERIIRFGTEKSVASQRIINQTLQDRKLVKRLVDEIGPRFANHKGGYTRILKLGTRPGDSAETALIELTVKKPKENPKKETKEAKKK